MKVKKFLYQLLAGISECHTKRIIHRDLKPANILIDATGKHRVRQTVYLKSQTSDSRGPTPFRFVPIRKKWSHFGTERQKYCWGPWTTARLSIFGPLAAYSLRWSPKGHCSRETVSSINYTGSLGSWALQTRKHGQEWQSSESTNRLFRTGPPSTFKTWWTAWLWTVLAWTYWTYWLIDLENVALRPEQPDHS